MRPILAILAVLVPLVAAAPASALIQVDKGIAGARLGNTNAEVRAALGRPASVRNGSNDFGPFTTFRRRVRGVRCGTVAGIRSCHTHEFRIGQVVTDFLIKRGKVTRVTVGRVLD